MGRADKVFFPLSLTVFVAFARLLGLLSRVGLISFFGILPLRKVPFMKISHPHVLEAQKHFPNSGMHKWIL